MTSAVATWLEKWSMKGVVSGTIDGWLDATPVPEVPYNRPFQKGKLEPFVVLHTSGSTGFPKPIVASQAIFCISHMYQTLPEWKGRRIFLHGYTAAKRLFIPLPLSHASGMYGFFGIIFWKVPVALTMPSAMITPESSLEMVACSKSDAVFLPPFFLEDLSTKPEAIEQLKQMTFVGFGGGPLASDAGNRLVENGVVLHNSVGSTEVSAFPFYWQNNNALWEWIIINSDILGAEWIPFDDSSNLFELVIHRKDENPGMQAVFYQMPHLSQFRTKDLFMKHPTEPDHWKFHGRVDETIVFSNGEKLNPVPIEGRLIGHPKISAAIVVGASRPQPALLLEAAVVITNQTEADKFIEEIWPMISSINQDTVTNGRISRHLITLASPKKPFPRLDKGTIRRRAAIQLYEAEINELYSQAETVKPELAPTLDTSSSENLANSILSVLRLNLDVANIQADTDFFAAGMDSLQMMEVIRLLRGGFEAAGINLPPQQIIIARNIYTNPTTTRLAQDLYSRLIQKQETSSDESKYQAQKLRITQTLLSKYSHDLPHPAESKSEPRESGQVILITGTTGRLGTYLLTLMSRNTRVHKIICLNRSANAKARQEEMCRKLGLDSLNKAEFLQADLSKEDFGLGYDTYKRLLNEVDRVIHAQWAVNFKLAVESFEVHIKGVRGLVDFSAHANHKVPIIFLSSILAAVGTKITDKEDDLETPTTGYGRSKLIAERVLDSTAKLCGIPTCTIRIGQISGHEGPGPGMIWEKKEWLPSVIGSSVKKLGVLPSDLGPMNDIQWMPVDRVASTVLELTGITTSRPLAQINGYFYCVNPNITSWTHIASHVAQYYGTRVTKLVTWKEWVNLLQHSAGSDENVVENPALELLDFLLDTTELTDTEAKQIMKFIRQNMDNKTILGSRTMSETQGITSQLMLKWCEEWAY
ncbi:putative NRPS-like protein biosynthetic cluster [Exserohilum turcicum]